jgi:L-threonylcarbamoyladenylate synthase
MKIIGADELQLAREAIEAGGLVVLPTRRWYMVCANAADHQACDRIFSGKRRPASKSLALVLPVAGRADDLFVMRPYAIGLANAFWPGDLAMLLQWRDLEVGRRHAAVGEEHALVTCDPGILGTLAAECGVPIAATTVNISGATNADGPAPAITTREVEQFVNQTGIGIVYCVEGGVSPLANHLTIVDCTAEMPTTVRVGVVHERAIQAVMAPFTTSSPTKVSP